MKYICFTIFLSLDYTWYQSHLFSIIVSWKRYSSFFLFFYLFIFSGWGWGRVLTSPSSLDPLSFIPLIHMKPTVSNEPFSLWILATLPQDPLLSTWSLVYSVRQSMYGGVRSHLQQLSSPSFMASRGTPPTAASPLQNTTKLCKPLFNFLSHFRFFLLQPSPFFSFIFFIFLCFFSLFVMFMCCWCTTWKLVETWIDKIFCCHIAKL